MTPERALLQLLRDIAETKNLTGTDFADVQVLEVINRDFLQQPGGGGYHVSFSVSGHAIGKTGKGAHDALKTLLPDDSGE